VRTFLRHDRRAETFRTAPPGKSFSDPPDAAPEREIPAGKRMFPSGRARHRTRSGHCPGAKATGPRLSVQRTQAPAVR